MFVDVTERCDQFLSAFDVFVQAVRRARGAAAKHRGSGLTLSQYGLLEPLLSQPDARVSELAAQAGVAAPTATRMLDALDRHGIVARTPSPDDRRGVSVALTPVGRVAVAGEHDWLRTRQRAFFAGLPADEQELVPDLLLRLASLIDEAAVGSD
jgi:MarR family transcriptional regulator, organic hydroperoxide resistance regulator